MPHQELTTTFQTALRRHADAVADLVPLLVEMVMSSIIEVLPGAAALETEGEMNEDWAFTLRVQRVLATDGAVLYDVESGDDDPEVEATIDEVGTDYLDLLLHLTGDEYMGRSTVRGGG